VSLNSAPHLQMPKARDHLAVDEEPCYNWLPFAEYALSPDLWIWLHDLLLHSKGSVGDIESRHKQLHEVRRFDHAGTFILLTKHGLNFSSHKILDVLVCVNYTRDVNAQTPLSTWSNIIFIEALLSIC